MARCSKETAAYPDEDATFYLPVFSNLGGVRKALVCSQSALDPYLSPLSICHFYWGKLRNEGQITGNNNWTAYQRIGK